MIRAVKQSSDDSKTLSTCQLPRATVYFFFPMRYSDHSVAPAVDCVYLRTAPLTVAHVASFRNIRQERAHFVSPSILRASGPTSLCLLAKIYNWPSLRFVRKHLRFRLCLRILAKRSLGIFRLLRPWC